MPAQRCRVQAFCPSSSVFANQALLLSAPSSHLWLFDDVLPAFWLPLLAPQCQHRLFRLHMVLISSTGQEDKTSYLTIRGSHVLCE